MTTRFHFHLCGSGDGTCQTPGVIEPGDAPGEGVGPSLELAPVLWFPSVSSNDQTRSLTGPVRFVGVSGSHLSDHHGHSGNAETESAFLGNLRKGIKRREKGSKAKKRATDLPHQTARVPGSSAPRLRRPLAAGRPALRPPPPAGAPGAAFIIPAFHTGCRW